MSNKVDGNVYVRMGAAEAANRPLVSWASVADANCMSYFDTLDDFRRQCPASRPRRVFINHSGAVFRSPEMRRFEPVGLLAGVPALFVPAEAQRCWAGPTCRMCRVPTRPAADYLASGAPLSVMTRRLPSLSVRVSHRTVVLLPSPRRCG